MNEKIVLLYETEQGKALCDVASRVLAQVAVAFGHTLKLNVKRSRGELTDEVLDLCADTKAVVAGDSDMACLPELADELLCACRMRELRYAHLLPNQSLSGTEKPLNVILVQALSSGEEALRLTAKQAYALSQQENLPITEVPPAGKLLQDWRAAVDGADSLSAPFHARETALSQVIPDMVHRPARLGVLLCPPYAGGILAEAASALSGAEGMGYDTYLGGQCALYAPVRAAEEQVNPFGLLRALYHLLRDALKLEQEAACLEAAIRNVLQAGWRTADIAQPGVPPLEAGAIADLICQQIEVAGEWIAKG